MRDVQISTDTIRLGQLLKLADAVPSGSDVKPLVASGAVLVDGEVEFRRGRQLHPGAIVSVAGVELRLV